MQDEFWEMGDLTLFSSHRRQPMRHGLRRRGANRQGSRFSAALTPVRVVILAGEGDQREGLRLFTRQKIILAAATRVCNQRMHGPELAGLCLESCNSFLPAAIVGRVKPIARATVLTPPYPRARASAAAQSRRICSSI